jgi:hypothetical protein
MASYRITALGLSWILSVACSPDPADGALRVASEDPPRLLETSRTHREWVPPGGPASQPASPRGPRCTHYRAERSAFFGDLHVHTSLSLDGYTRGGFQTPSDAYRFAKGERIGLAPRGADGAPLRFAALDRPLDFAAVTDHAEWIGELETCKNPASPAFASVDCQVLRSMSLATASAEQRRLLGSILSGGQREPGGVCGADAKICREYAGYAWLRTQAAAAEHQDATDQCMFTTFNAWEYSATPGLSKVHRNVILRNDAVPEMPISWAEEGEVEGLWQKLKRRCNDTDTGCEALTIPHNANLSNGQMFTVTYKDRSLEEQRARAELQASLEPLVEIIQSKGESECRMGMYGVIGGEDELCGFEKVRFVTGERPADCEEGSGAGALTAAGCQSRLDFVRYGLIEGLREYARIGVNPYLLGFMGSTDTHNGTPGATEEYNYFGHNSEEDDTLDERLTRQAYAAHPMRNPGGLIGVWAEENSRDALFDAMKRRETFATSGVRIKPRLFAGWDLPENLCQAPDGVAEGYRRGVPMGAALDAESREGSMGPIFYASALRDPGSQRFAGTGLQRIQIVKGEVDSSGEFRETIADIAVDDGPAAEVDADCIPTREGANTLCAVWQDPTWDPRTPAVYYARVLEQPSCRWHARQCLELPADERPAACSNNSLPRSIQERAWTSPIWYHP